MNDPDGREDRGGIGWATAGAFVGIVLSLALQYVGILTGMAEGLDGDGGNGSLLMLLAAVAPALIGIPLLFFDRSRRLATGFFTGVATGAIITGGICSFMVINVMSA